MTLQFLREILLLQGLFNNFSVRLLLACLLKQLLALALFDQCHVVILRFNLFALHRELVLALGVQIAENLRIGESTRYLCGLRAHLNVERLFMLSLLIELRSQVELALCCQA